MHFVIWLTVLHLVVGSSLGGLESKVAQSFINDKILSKIVTVPPTRIISVSYGQKSIYLGTTVQPLQTLKQPQVYYEAKEGAFYTLLFFGPDLPPSIVPPLTQLIHWGVYNIPGNDISKGVPFAEYFPPIPYPGGFPYVFLLFEQNGLLDESQVPNLSPILKRPKFSYLSFTEKYNLGNPIAGNFMHEAYVQLVPQAIQSIYNIVG